MTQHCPFYDISAATGATSWDTGNSGSIPQSLSHPADSQVSATYVSNAGPSTFGDTATNGEAATEGQISHFPSGEDISRFLDSLSDGNQCTAVGDPWSCPSDIPANPDFTPFFLPQFDPEALDGVLAQLAAECFQPLSFTGLLQDALDSPAPMQYAPGRSDNHTISVIDENILAGPTITPMRGPMYPHLLSHMREERTPALLQPVNNTRVPFPTLNAFTCPVSGLPQWPTMHPNQHYPLYHSASTQAPVYQIQSSLDDGSGDAYSKNFVVTDPNYLDLGQPNEVYAPAVYHGLYQGQSVLSQTAVESAHGYSDTTTYTAMRVMMDPATVVPSLQDSCGTQSLNGNIVSEPSAFTPCDLEVDDRHMPSKRKADDDIRAVNVGPSPPSVGTKARKRRRMGNGKPEVKNFGAYVTVSANVTAMAEPTDDPHPVDISGRADGKNLRTRMYGAMEIDASYGNRSAAVSDELPTDLTCVRACEWTDRPCGLYIEPCKDRISDHLFKWHGVGHDAKIPCKYRGCTATSPMNTLGRHIETVHFNTKWQCRPCLKTWSRNDAMTRHQNPGSEDGCPSFKRALEQAKREGYKIRGARKVLSGYIIPIA
ncbi:hypothetical protein K503DRAFT_769991 [Rhizopogon vinicolor AM-OR11-026]|uniref:Uncharacterized protein n=1 Tax=Rhizopogon vinicolor AM-OR11-026 TaxID=1314800 RepID=A0A1B7N216_9AGAM|nr:hypothetical protein K503DRAFT_769991 [Rhizopogon vinicolor AM-OR11-026]